MLFQYSAAFLAFSTAAAKLTSAIGQQNILDMSDPILGVPNRVLLVAIGVLELVAVAFLLGAREKRFSFLFVGMLGGQFLLYRTVFALGNYPTGCPCLGTMTQWLPVSKRNIDIALWLIAVWLLVGGILSFYLSATPERLKRVQP